MTTDPDLAKALNILEAGRQLARWQQTGQPTDLQLSIGARTFLEDLFEEDHAQYEMLVAWCEGKSSLNENLIDQLTRRHLIRNGKPHPVLLKELGLESQ